MRLPTEPEAIKRAREELDGLVVNAELTLISIIQGIALSILSSSASALLSTSQVTLWLYVAVGLLTILLFWSRSLIHILTVIRWPLEFGHNFLYIGGTLVEAVMFSEMANVEYWFLAGAAYSVTVLVIYAYDLRMIRREMASSAGPAGQRLFSLLAQEQSYNVRILMPASIAFHGLAAAAIHYWPDLMITRQGHVALVLTQLVVGALYLNETLRLYARVSPLVLAHRAEVADETRQSAP